jgi:hypothetical protein
MTDDDGIFAALWSLPKSKYGSAARQEATKSMKNAQILAGGTGRLHANYFLVSRVSASSICSDKPV